MTNNSNGRRVVVTGMGFITPIGNDLETVWSNMVEGVSGIGQITHFDTTNFDTKIAGEVKGFNPEDYMDRKTARHIGRYCQFALGASKQALAHAGLDPAEMDPDDVGVIVSSGIGGMEEIEKSHTQLMERGPKRISPFTVPMMIADMAAGIVAIHCHAGGPNYAIVSACASGSHGIGEASEIIKRGDAVAMLAGGSEATITPLTMGAFCQIKAVSERNDEPEKACRPFDLGRDGFVMSEGSVMLVLEDMEHAKKRGAKIYAEIAGLRRQRRHVPLHGAATGRQGRDSRHAPRAREERCRADRCRLHQRARNLHQAGRPRGDEVDQGRLSATTRTSSRSARRSRCTAICLGRPAPSKPRRACSPLTGGCCRRPSTSMTPTPSATSTTSPTRRARRTSRWPCRTHSASAATTPRS